MALQDLRDHLDLQVPMEIQDHKDLKASRVHLALQGFQVPQDIQGLQDLKGLEETRDLREYQVQEDLLVHQGYKVLKAHQVQKAWGGQKGPMDHQDHTAPKVPRGYQG